eukprot:TRINITY_DN76_c0_g1_i2.p1 TRINITY_DN76_c0_g1~~TRINITY_DN76_c0_g1_i2.p1  ORF type:complete len:342 (+),score=74.25 TRINITY_DN76_c0_g1_i2:99-1028(+)
MGEPERRWAMIKALPGQSTYEQMKLTPTKTLLPIKSSDFIKGSDLTQQQFTGAMMVGNLTNDAQLSQIANMEKKNKEETQQNRAEMDLLHKDLEQKNLQLKHAEAQLKKSEKKSLETKANARMGVVGCALDVEIASRTILQAEHESLKADHAKLQGEFAKLQGEFATHVDRIAMLERGSKRLNGGNLLLEALQTQNFDEDFRAQMNVKIQTPGGILALLADEKVPGPISAWITHWIALKNLPITLDDLHFLNKELRLPRNATAHFIDPVVIISWILEPGVDPTLKRTLEICHDIVFQTSVNNHFTELFT